jgi:putative sterol carrier protein
MFHRFPDPEKRANVLDWPGAVTGDRLSRRTGILNLTTVRGQMLDMSLTDLRQLLEASFHPPAARALDALLRIQVGEETLDFRVTHGELDFDTACGARPDTTFRFADHATALALLTGREDAFEAFMSGRFRADGYLMWAFTLMAMFRSQSLPATPTE